MGASSFETTVRTVGDVKRAFESTRKSHRDENGGFYGIGVKGNFHIIARVAGLAEAKAVIEKWWEREDADGHGAYDTYPGSKYGAAAAVTFRMDGVEFVTFFGMARD
jgi:hypothetical protein